MVDKFNNIQVKVMPDRVTLPKKSALNQFEKEMDFPLPMSYRDFILQFGPGEIAGEIQIAAPGYPNHFDQVDLQRSIHRYRDFPEELLEKYSEPERALRLLVFAMTTNADMIGWDPEDIRDQGTHECGIYLIPHDGFEVQHIANSFQEFIDNYCLTLPAPTASHAPTNYVPAEDVVRPAEVEMKVELAVAEEATRYFELVEAFADSVDWPEDEFETKDDFVDFLLEQLEFEPEGEWASRFELWKEEEESGLSD